MMDSVGNCNCLHGTAVVDANGNCHCLDSSIVPPGTGGVRPIPFGTGGPRGGIFDPNPNPQTVNYNYNFLAPAGGEQPLSVGKALTSAAGAPQPTIFGMSPIVALGIGAVGLWILSSMDGKK